MLLDSEGHPRRPLHPTPEPQEDPSVAPHQETAQQTLFLCLRILEWASADPPWEERGVSQVGAAVEGALEGEVAVLVALHVQTAMVCPFEFPECAQ